LRTSRSGRLQSHTNPTFARARDQSGKTKLARAKTRAKRPTKQPVDLIDDDHIDLARLDIGDQPFQGWPLRRMPVWRSAWLLASAASRSPSSQRPGSFLS